MLKTTTGVNFNRFYLRNHTVQPWAHTKQITTTVLLNITYRNNNNKFELKIKEKLLYDLYSYKTYSVFGVGKSMKRLSRRLLHTYNFILEKDEWSSLVLVGEKVSFW